MENEENTLDTVFQDLLSSFNQGTTQSQKNFLIQLLQWVKQQEESISISNDSDLQSETVQAVEDALISTVKKRKEGVSPKDLHTLFSTVPQLRQVAEKLEQAIWIRELKTGYMLYVSPAFETIWGRSCDSLYEDPKILIDSVHPEDRVQVLVSTSHEDYKPFNQVYRVLRPEGTLRWIFSRTFLIRDKNQKPYCHFCIAEDFTEQKSTELTLRKTLDRTHEQFALSRKMSLARKPETVLKTLMSAQELRSAQRAALLFFDSPKLGPTIGVELLATWQTTRNLPVWMNESSLYEESALWELAQPKRPVIINTIPSDPRLNPQEREILMDEDIQTLIIFPLVALADWVGCLFVYYQQEHHFDHIDLRHLKVLVDQASITLYNLKLLLVEEDLRREAERANEIKSEFLAMISHELRTPLTSIIGFTTTMLAKDVHWEPEEQLDFIQTIQSEGFRLQELIDHLLDLSRLEAGILPISPEPVSLYEIMEDAMPQLHTLASEKTLTIQLPSNLPPVYADTKRISQVLVNLVRNAAAYSPRGTEIKITANIQKEFLKINVIDQGPGIPMADHKRVFRAFQRGTIRNNEILKGAGLGLAICKGLVDAHNGRIWIKKKTTPGTTISFTLPLVSEHVKIEIDEVS
ncbi:MAG: PAS domain-containing protein [Anaerolineaceae bacterium]|nr:PAS domain-containing protein [Anaerolineaceae bacterium]